MLKYSIVVPFHNEEANVTELYSRLTNVMEAVGESFEVVFVDDGSRDTTFQLLQQIASVDSRVVVVRLRRNFGQTSALAAGFDHAHGEYVIAMDGDLQHEPGDIPNFIDKLNEGFDIVSGWRQTRPESLFLRRIPSRCANWLMAKLSGVAIHDFGTTFKAYRRDILENVALYGEMHRFIPALASWYGATICEIPITSNARFGGKSHYGFSRTFRVFFDLLTIRFLLKYASRPLHFFGSAGMVGVISGFIIAFVLGMLKIFTHQHVMTSHGPLLIFAAVLIIAGIQLVGLGLLGDMQVRHRYDETAPRPYSVRTVLGRSESEERRLD